MAVDTLLNALVDAGAVSRGDVAADPADDRPRLCRGARSQRVSARWHFRAALRPRGQRDRGAAMKRAPTDRRAGRRPRWCSARAAAVGGGSTPAAAAAASAAPAPAPAAAPTSYYTAPAQDALTTAEVGTIIAQAVAEAKARNLPSDIAVVRPGRQRAGGVPHDRRAARPRRSRCPPSGSRHRRAGRDLPRRRRRDRQGGHRRLSVERRQRLHHPHRQPDRAGAFPARRRQPSGWKAGRCSACSSASCPARTCRRAISRRAARAR